MELKLEAVSKAYAGRTVLREITACIPDRGVCALLGVSGAGKTTLLRLLLNLEKPDSGRILGLPREKSVLFQEDRLFPDLDLDQNLKMVLGHYDRSKARELMDLLGLDGSRKALHTYSGGMSRRAALMRALLGSGPLLILDEPFSGLDAENRTAAGQAVSRFRGDRMLIYTAHDAPDPLLPAPDIILRLSPQECTGSLS